MKNCLLARAVFWAAALALFPVSVKIWPRSFQVEVLQRISFVALPQERVSAVGQDGVSWTGRVLLHLEAAEKQETDPWLRDDLRIAWIATRWAQHGIPSWSLHGYATPYEAATWQVLQCHPDQVWPRILAAREAKLGKLHDKVWGDASSPRKPVRSVKLDELRRRDPAA
jgi:hypothetical protein